MLAGEQKNMNIWELSEAYLKEMMQLDPLSSTYMGDPSQDHLWSDLSMKGVHLHLALSQRYLKQLEKFQEETLPTREWVAFRILKESLTRSQQAYDRGEHYYDLNTIASTFQVLRSIFDLMGTKTETQWRNILSRLQKLPQAIADYQSRLAEGITQQRVVAKLQIRMVLKHLKVLSTDSKPDQANFYRGLVSQMKQAGLPNALTSELEPTMNQAVDQVLQALQGFSEFLEKTYLPQATEQDGVGEDRYRYYAEKFLGIEIHPQEAYEWGWKEFYRLEGEMKRIAHELAPEKTLAEVIRDLKTNPAFVCKSQEDFAKLMLARQLKAIQDLDGEHFHIPEEAKKIEIKLAPKGTSLGAYYQGPSEDFSRPGQVWYSYGDQQTIPYYSEIATAYHEGFPGHHLQVCIAHLQKELSRYHRLCVWYPGYGEGWALYTERLMEELGYYEKKEFLMGMLKEQLRRAFRVVVDIGLHLSLKIPTTEAFHPGEVWTPELGEKFLIERVFEVPAEAHDEIIRYLGWPGQAICYKLGEKIFLELRDYAKNKLQDRFDLKWFHQLVLEMGPLSLEMLKDLVYKAVEQKNLAS